MGLDGFLAATGLFTAIRARVSLRSVNCRLSSALVRYGIIVLAVMLPGCGQQPATNEASSGGPTDSGLPHTAVEEQRSFVEITDESGLNFVHDAGELGEYPMPQIMGPGAALFDCDGDGLLDVYLVGGGSLKPGPPTESSNSQVPAPGRLFRQQADGTFTDITASSGLMNSGYGMGTAVGDIDNDGDLDLYLTNYGTDRLYRNNGDCTWTDITESAGISNTRWSTAACFADFDRDGFLDLFVANYVDYYPGTVCLDGSGRRDYCVPTDFAPTADKLFHNEGALTAGGDVGFTDVTVSSGLAVQSGRGLGVACRDFSGDHRPDIFVANDKQANRLWVQQENGTFRNEALFRGVAVNHLGEEEASMGISCGDVNGDRQTDLFLTHFGGETNTLYLGSMSGQFTDATPLSGLGQPGLPYTGFGTALVDLEHDGDLDLMVVNGRVTRGAFHTTEGSGNTSEMKTPSGTYWKDYVQPNQWFLNNGQGRFTESAGGSDAFTHHTEVSRGLAVGDIDQDGDLDLLVTNCGGRARLFRNQFPDKGHWLLVRAVNPELKRDAIGAQICLHIGEQRWQREVGSASGYLTANDIRIHVGVGEARNYDAIFVRWPTKPSTVEVFPPGELNRFLVLTRGDGSPAAVEEIW